MSELDRDLMTVLPYALEVDRQCRLALAASDQMAASVEVFWPIATPQSAVGDFFDHAQRFFSSAAAIGKILYARGNPARETRARHLRSVFALADDSSLATWSTRNALEHVDERIDTWVRENPGALRYSPHGISRTGQIPPGRTMRHYDSESDRLRV